MRHLRITAILWMGLGTAGSFYYYSSAINDLAHGRSDMLFCFMVAILLMVGASGLFFGKLWSRILTGLLVTVVGCSSLVILLLMLGRRHYAYAFASAVLLSICLYGLFAILMHSPQD
jgi:hypothetical protein